MGFVARGCLCLRSPRADPALQPSRCRTLGTSARSRRANGTLLRISAHVPSRWRTSSARRVPDGGGVAHRPARAPHHAGRHDAAIEQYRKTIELSPQLLPLHLELAQVYADKEMFAEAFAALDAVKHRGWVFAMMAARTGRPEEARPWVDEQLRQGRGSSTAVASVCGWLGERDRAFDILNKAVDERSPWLPFLNVMPAFAPLRSDARYAALAARIGLPPAR